MWRLQILFSRAAMTSTRLKLRKFPSVCVNGMKEAECLIGQAVDAARALQRALTGTTPRYPTVSFIG